METTRLESGQETGRPASAQPPGTPEGSGPHKMDPPSLEPGFHLEAKSHSEGECCGGCLAPPAPPALAGASPEEAGQGGEDVPLAAAEG